MTRFRLVDRDWGNEVETAAAIGADRLRIVCPFIKAPTIRRLLGRRPPADVRVVTRFNLADFDAGVSDTSALRALIDAGACIRGIQGLHAKLYIFGNDRVILTSANLTERAMWRNQEFGFVSSDPDIIRQCHDYFDSLWPSGANDLDAETLDTWERALAAVRSSAPVPGMMLPDYGVQSDVVGEVEPGFPGALGNAYAKFFGSANNRAPRDLSVFDEVLRSGSHWACTYPRGKRPRRIADGDRMFMARMVAGPDDYLVYGDAVARRHQPRADDASAADLARRDWKIDWPHYVRVTRPRFLNGPISNGVSLRALMDALGSNAFTSTQRNARAGQGNTLPSRALMQKPDVQLTPEAHDWLRLQLDRQFALHGQMDLTDPRLDWPD